MKNDIGYYSPSYKRAKGVTTQDIYSEVQYVVSESEAKAYEENGHRCWVVPDSAQGSVCRIRNYILDNAPESKVVILDDDLKGIGVWNKQKSRILEEDEFYEFVEKGFILADDLGIKYWGINLLSDKGCYREYSPFSFTSVILGPFQAFNGLDLRYDENLPLKEDYDLSLQVLNKYRKTLRFNAYHYLAKQHVNVGGCADYRSMEREKEQMQLLIKKWGSKIVKQDSSSKGDINPVVRVPIKGI
jgi:hypothetical protein